VKEWFFRFSFRQPAMSAFPCSQMELGLTSYRLVPAKRSFHPSEHFGKVKLDKFVVEFLDGD
jgi:hypothetical protein